MKKWIFHRLLRPRICTQALSKLSASFSLSSAPLPLGGEGPPTPCSLPGPRPDVWIWITAQTSFPPKFACYSIYGHVLGLVHWGKRSKPFFYSLASSRHLQKWLQLKNDLLCLLAWRTIKSILQTGLHEQIGLKRKILSLIKQSQTSMLFLSKNRDERVGVENTSVVSLPTGGRVF